MIDLPVAQPTVNPLLPELLAPAGNWECAKAAVENGADAIYFGLERFNARMRAENFTVADLPQLMAFLHRRGVKGYVTLNTLVFTDELAAAEQYLRSIITAGVDAAIVQDVGICRLIRHLSPDFPIHASTQMTITSATGVEFAHALGCQLVVLARECSLKEIEKIRRQLGDRNLSLPLEVFVHGALCVAYSGQCLTSEALGGRSANRGECAQACRMPYDLISDGKQVDLGDRAYLLSPQDLAGLDVLPQLVQTGVACLKIEGRLKSPEYVANVTRTYRQALDRAMQGVGEEGETQRRGDAEKGRRGEGERGKNTQPSALSPQHLSDRYNLEMAFSRGLHTGWFEGVNNQKLVHAQFGKKRGVLLGEVARIQGEKIIIKLEARGTRREAQNTGTRDTNPEPRTPNPEPLLPVKPGDGVVFDNGHPEAREEGGRIYAIATREQEAVLTFGRGAIDFRRVNVGDRVWKTSDPELDRQIRQTYAGDTPKFVRPIDVEIYGEIGQTLVAIARDRLGHVVQVESQMPLVEAQRQPLTTERLQEQFARLGNTPFRLKQLTNHMVGSALLPVSELNRLRRDIVARLEELRSQPQRWELRSSVTHTDLLPTPHSLLPNDPTLIVLVRNLAQLRAVLQTETETIYCEFEDPRAYKEAVRLVRAKGRRQAEVRGTGQEAKGSSQKHKIDSSSFIPHPSSFSFPALFVAPPRITKPGETWILEQVRASHADGYLVRNYDQLKFFKNDRCIGDFSLNVANPITAHYFKQLGLERLTASYDLNISQLESLLSHSLPGWFEVTVHQHMPMFHMEHCVFCAFLSEGTDYTNCGRPCEKHEVKLRDRVGTEHRLQADAGCRNTVFNGTAQTGAEYVKRLLDVGQRHFRLEFLHETPAQVTQTIQRYEQLLHGKISGTQLWQELRLQNQLGVTRGPLEGRLSWRPCD